MKWNFAQTLNKYKLTLPEKLFCYYQYPFTSDFAIVYSFIGHLVLLTETNKIWYYTTESMIFWERGIFSLSNYIHYFCP